MYIINKSPTFKFAVTIAEPGQSEDGTTAAQSITLIGKRLGRKAQKAWLDGLKGKEDAAGLLEVIVGWENVAYPEPVSEPLSEPVPVPFSAEAFEDFIDDAPGEAAVVIFQAYIKARNEASLKNSKGPLAG